MSSPRNTTNTGEAGVALVQFLVNVELGWYFRTQLVDVGIDAQMEVVLDGVASGRLLGLQIKAGTFKERAPDGNGLVYRENTQTHRRYWRRYQVPVLLVLCDLETRTAYWQLINAETAEVTGAGFKVVVPADQRLDASARQTLANLARYVPADQFDESLRDLPAMCAASLSALMDRAPDLAQELADGLLNGPSDPGTVVHKLSAAGSPKWHWLAWLALADYAAEHGLNTLAADCFLRAEDRLDDSTLTGRYRAYAGILLIDSAPERAKDLFVESTASNGGALLGAIGLALLAHGRRPGPTPIPKIILERPDQAALDATVQRFLADQALRRGEVDLGISLHEKALELSPSSPKQKLALAEALLRRPQPGTSGTQLADYRRAANLAADTRAAQRRYGADSIPAAVVLLHALTLGGDERSAIQVAMPAPGGDATDLEAASPALAFYAARLSFETGDVAAGKRFGETIAASRQTEWITQWSAVRAANCGADDSEQIRRWQDVLDTSVPDDRRLVALDSLAALGRWPLPDLERLREAGHLTDGTYDATHAKALAAAGDSDAALAILRGGAKVSLITAEACARQLAALGHVDECVSVCEEATLRFGDPRLDLYALDVLTEADRLDEVISRAHELLGRSDLPFNLRRRVRGNLIDIHVQRGDWIRCERLSRDGMNEVAQLQRDLTAGRADPQAAFAPAAHELASRQRDYAWMIITSQANRGAIDEAFETLEAHRPQPVSPEEIQIWVTLHQARGWTSSTAEQALELSRENMATPDTARPLLIFLLQYVDAPDGAGVPAGQDFQERLTQTCIEFADRHPAEAQRFVTDMEPRPGQLHELLIRGTPLYRQTLEAVQKSQLALGALSATIRRPYLLSLVEQAAGFLPAVAPVPALHEQELQAAREALGGTVSIEGTALYVAAGLAQQWPVMRESFSSILIAEPAAHDVMVSHNVLQQPAASGGGVPGSRFPKDQSAAASATERARRERLALATRVRDAAQQSQSVAVTDLSALRTPPPSLEITGAWLGPLAVAAGRRIPLHSDDVFLRATARVHGIPAFGTMALIEVLIETGRIDPAEVEIIIRRLFEGKVVDLPNVWPLAVRAGQDAGSSSLPVLINAARPWFWDDVGEENLVTVITALAMHMGDRPEEIETITTAMADGLTGAIEPPEQILGILGALIIAHRPKVSVEIAAPILRAVQRVAARYSVDVLPALRERLVATLIDRAGALGLSVMEAEQVAGQTLAPLEERLQ